MLCIAIIRYCFCAESDSKFTKGVDWVKNRLYSELHGLSPRTAVFMKRALHYIIHEPNPIMQCLYLTIVLSAWTCMVIYGYPIIRNPSNTFISSYHCNVGYFVYALCLYTFYRACTVPAGNLTENTLEKYDNYAYDNVLYVPRICKTLSFRKVARSKFDRATNKHVPRFDHFCVWLNQPIGEENYRDFLLFLLVHCAMLCYGSYASARALWFVVKYEGLLRVKFVNRATGKTVAGSPLVIFRYMAHSHAAIICLLVLSTIMGLVMIIFTLFHLWLCGRGMTTNEYFKWRDIWS